MEFICREVGVEDIIACSLGLKKSELAILEYICKNDRASAQEIATALVLDRTTVQKIISSLIEKDIIKRFQENLEHGGYIFRYAVKDKTAIKKKIHGMIDSWHKTARSSIDAW